MWTYFARLFFFQVLARRHWLASLEGKKCTPLKHLQHISLQGAVGRKRTECESLRNLMGTNASFLFPILNVSRIPRTEITFRLAADSARSKCFDSGFHDKFKFSGIIEDINRGEIHGREGDINYAMAGTHSFSRWNRKKDEMGRLSAMRKRKRDGSWVHSRLSWCYRTYLEDRHPSEHFMIYYLCLSQQLCSQ